MNRTSTLILWTIAASSAAVHCGGPSETVSTDDRASELSAAACSALSVASVTAIGDDGNVPANVLDGNLTTRWSHLGQGSWIQADLGSLQSVCSVQLAWFVGDTRKSHFQVALSSDGTTFTTVFSGDSSGTSLALESYAFTPANGRYVRVTVNGNTNNDWSSVTELKIAGGAATSPPPPPPPPPPGFPQANNTGYPHGLAGDTRAPVTLTPYTGPCTITAAGTVIDGKDITCELFIRANDVVIKNSRIRVANSAAVHTTDLVNLLIQDTELDGQGQDASVGGISLIGDGGYTLRRVDAHGSGDILRADWWTEVYDSWLHDPRGLSGENHNDVIQTTQTDHIRIVHNRLENPNTQTSCILLKADLGPIGDVLIDGNLMNGGGYSFYWYDAGHKISNGTVSNNRFMRAPTGGFWPKGGFFGPAALDATTLPRWTNNVWDDNGTPITE